MARTLSLVIRNLLFTVAVPGPGGGLGAWPVLTRNGHTPVPVAWEATVVIAAGLALYAWCTWNFAAVGGGTPRPVGRTSAGGRGRAAPVGAQPHLHRRAAGRAGAGMAVHVPAGA